jgi:hypothetical protein
MILLALVALLLAAAPATAAAEERTTAGVAKVDATWHVGASAGQFTDEGGALASDGIDPYGHTTKKRISDGVGLRTSTRALVVKDTEGDRVAIVSTDLYLPNDFLTRRVGSLLAARDRDIALGLEEGTPTGIDGSNLAVTASHNHNTPFYSTPGWGTAIFQDVMDVRFYEYMATRMADAVQRASARLVEVRMGGTTRTFDAIQSHTYGPKVGDDGTPAGQPWDHTTKQVSVLRFDDMSDRARPKPLATWVVFGVHPEWTWGYDLINGDITHATPCGRRCRQPQPFREMRLGDQPERHRLPVRPHGKARDRLQGVTDGVPRVEGIPELALFLRVTLDDAGLQAAGPADDPGQRVEVAVQEPCRRAFDVGEVVGVEHDPMLHDLGQARAKFPIGQGSHDRGVDDHQPRLVKGADQVLRLRMVDGRLPADRRVDLRQHRRGELHEVHATHVRRGDEPRDIADGSTAERQDRRRPIGPRGEETIPAALGHREGLRRLALRHLEERHAEARTFKTLGHSGPVEPHHGGVTHEDGACANAEVPEPGADGAERTRLGDDGV